METVLPTRQRLTQAIKELPAESLPELAHFIDYLRYKTARTALDTETRQPTQRGNSFLLSIAGIAEFDETDLSERDEEVLANEVDPIRGWGLPGSKTS